MLHFHNFLLRKVESANNIRVEYLVLNDDRTNDKQATNNQTILSDNLKYEKRFLKSVIFLKDLRIIGSTSFI